MERLEHVVSGLGERKGIVDPQRAEGRIPHQPRAYRRADESRIGDLHRWPELGEMGRSAVAEHGAGIAEHRDLEPELGRKKRDRRLRLRRGDKIFAAAYVIQYGRGRELARD